MRKNNKTLFGLDKNEIIIFLIGMAIFTVGLISYYKTYAINSDDVAQKMVLHQASANNDIWVPADHFILKAPVNFLVDAFLSPSSQNIFLAAWLMNLICFALYFWVAIYFLKKYTRYENTRHGFYLAFLSICAVGGGFLVSLASPQYRNLEIGIAFMFLWFIDKYISPIDIGKLTRSKLLVPALGLIAFAIFVYSDPAFYVYLAAPLVLTLGIYSWYQQKYRPFVPVFAFLVAGFLLYELLNKLLFAIGFQTYGVPAAFVPWERLGTNITAAIQSVLYLQNASFFSLPVAKAKTVFILLNLLILLAVFILPLKLYKQKKFWLTFMLVQPAFLLATFVLSSTVYPNTTSTRYLVLLPFYGAIIIAWATENMPKFLRNIVLPILVISIMGNVAITAKRVYALRNNHPNSYNQKIARLVNEKNLKKGYAPYWNAGITGFFSGHKAGVFPVTYSLDKDEITPYYININAAEMEQRASRTFIIVSNYPGAAPTSEIEHQAQYSSKGTFRAESAVKQFGPPKEVIGVTQFTSIYIYDYDLLDKMPKRHNFTDAQQ